MPRYPSNVRRNPSSGVTSALRRDSFQGRRRGALERRASGGPRYQPPTVQPETPSVAELEGAVEIALDVLPIPYAPLLRRMLHLWQDYERLNAIFSLNNSGYYVDPGVWFVHPTGWCATPRGTPYGQSRIGGGGCGEVHEFNDDPLPLTGASLDMCFIDPLVPGLFAKWRATFWGNYQRVLGTEGDIGLFPAVPRFPLPGYRAVPWPQLNPGAEPVEVPGMPVRPDPLPVPFAMQDALPKEDPMGQPLRGYEIAPETPKVPEFVVMPIEGLGPIYLPVAAVGTEVVLSPGTSPVARPSRHENRKPPFRTKERKFILSMASGSAAGMFVSAVTEADDFVDDLWRALPDDLRKSKKRYKGKDGRWHAAKVGELQKFAALLGHYQEIDVGKALYNVLVDQATDAAYGRLGQLNAKAQRNVHNSGYGPGVRNLGNPSNLANRGQISGNAGALSPVVKRSVDAFLSNF